MLQLGRQRFVTELGVIELLDALARGCICENYGAPFRLPDFGPIGGWDYPPLGPFLRKNFASSL